MTTTDAASAAVPSTAEQLAGTYLVLRVADELYGIGVLEVREIIRPPDVTRVPHAEPCVRGVINLRGRMVTVVDLPLRLGGGRQEATPLTVIVVVRCAGGDGQRVVGLLVDEVLDVSTVPASAIDPPPDVGGELRRAGLLLGIGRPNERIVFLLDLPRVLAMTAAADPSSAPTRSRGAGGRDPLPGPG